VAVVPNSYHDHPECPECETDVFVEHYCGVEGFICHSCGLTFDALDPSPDARQRDVEVTDEH
jgi:transposase-like protein